MQIVQLFIVDLELGYKKEKFLIKNLKKDQIEKAFIYKNDNDRIRSLISSYLKNQLSDEEINKNEMGKPYFINGPFFNISHSGKYVVMAVSDSNIGVDIEEDIEKNLNILLKIFNEAEVKMIKEHADFYFIWCAKESLIKCMGGSINKVRDIPSLPLNGLKTYKGIDYQSQTLIYDKHIISITKEGSEPFEIKIQLIKKLPAKIK